MIRGEKDPIAPEAWTRTLSRRLPEGHHLVLPGAHTLVFTDPEPLAYAIRRFISEGSPETVAAPEKPPPGLASFDSASALARATSRVLHGWDFPVVGLPRELGPLLRFANRLPKAVRETIYSISGWQEAVSPGKLGSWSCEQADASIASRYPNRRYPAVFIGASNGAAAHLCAAMQAPFLPQTTLVAVRRFFGRVNDLPAALEWGKTHAPLFLSENPHVQLHHMHDPNQDHLMLRHMAYFRVKRRRLGDAFTRFIRDRLAPDGTVYVLECMQKWPSVDAGPNHIFQSGALGGLDSDAYLDGSSAVAEFLEKRGSGRRKWNGVVPDGLRPEAEWGFEPALLEDLHAVSRRLGMNLVRIRFGHPEDLSPMTADLYRMWLSQRGIARAGCLSARLS